MQCMSAHCSRPSRPCRKRPFTFSDALFHDVKYQQVQKTHAEGNRDVHNNHPSINIASLWALKQWALLPQQFGHSSVVLS